MKAVKQVTTKGCNPGFGNSVGKYEAKRLIKLF